MVCKFHKELYSLKQDPRAWYERLHAYMVRIGFARANDNINMYLKVKNVRHRLRVMVF